MPEKWMRKALNDMFSRLDNEGLLRPEFSYAKFSELVNDFIRHDPDTDALVEQAVENVKVQNMYVDAVVEDCNEVLAEYKRLKEAGK